MTATQVNIEGDVSGQIAVGSNIIQIQNHGGVVNVVKPSSRTPFKKRTGPIRYTPRPFPALLDRVDESQAIRASMQGSVSVSVFGEGGIGKTTFLSHMAHLPEVNKYSDGVVYLYVRELGLDDLLQILFDTFFSSAGNVMPTVGQLRHHLQGIRAVILLDDLMLAREDVQALIAAMPLSCFVLASVERSLWGDGELISLGGLPEDEQVELFAREIERPLSEVEKIDALIICYYLQGHPLKIIQAASLVTSSGKTISEIKKQLQGSSTTFSTVRELLNGLNESQKKVLAVLWASGGTLIPLGIIGSLLKLPGVQGVLKSLVNIGLAWNQGPEYGIAGSLAAQIGRLWNLSSWEDALINYFSNWLAQQQKDSLIEEASDTLIHVIQMAGEKNRWPEVISLGRALERILILRKRWQAWSDILNLILKAAKAYGDRHTEAWALHQLGSRAMCLNYIDQARQFLTQALDIRRAIGDKDGVAVTQHNLNVLQVGAPVTSQPPKPPEPESELGKYLAYGFGGMAALAVMVLAVLWAGLQSPPPTQIPNPVVISSSTFLFTSTPPIFTSTYMNTFTETSTLTFTPTDTVTASFTPSATPSRTPTNTQTITSIPTTITMPPDTSGPSAPDILGPPAIVGRNNPLNLSWRRVSDPSGINVYRIKLYIGIFTQGGKSFPFSPTIWDIAASSVNCTTSFDSCSLNVYNKTACGRSYKWTVQAQDKEGNWGEISTGYFDVNACAVD